MSEKKPIPSVIEPNSKKCPICGKASYSQGGIHPQCAMAQADGPRRMKLAADKKALAHEKAEADRGKLRTWEKSCPKCKTRMPANRPTCPCGHHFMRD
jgi:RNA polymerase subunit RPABC4/transcription elongation factor Spt4